MSSSSALLDSPDGDALLRSLLDLSRDLLLVVDVARDEVVDASAAALAALGRSAGEMRALPLSALTLTPRDWARTGEGPFEESLRRADGTSLRVEITSRPHRAGGRALLLVCARDLTERARFGDALRASEERLRILINGLHVGVLVQGAKAEILLSNPQACELLGVTEDQLLGKTSFDPDWSVIHEDGSPFPGPTHPVPTVIATGKPQRNVIMGVYRPTKRDRVWLLVDAEPTLDASGGVEKVICTFSNVTALKEATRVSRANAAMLREAQRIARVGSFEWRPGQPAMTWSEELHSIAGTIPGDFVPTRQAVNQLIAPGERERVDALFRHAATSKLASFEFETSYRPGQGEPRHLVVRGETTRDAEGRLDGGLRGTVQDITERKRAEVALQESEERLRQAQKLEAIGRLAGGVAHDFNNMLTPIMSYAHLLLGTVPSGDPMREPLEEICGAAERAAALTLQLLTFSRQQVVQRRPTQLNEVISKLHQMLGRILGEDIEVVLRLAPSAGLVLADAGQIEQILLNLAVNARDAMPKGGRLTIETANEVRDAIGDAPASAWVRLSVSDTGTGMDAETRARLFEPFFTTKPPGKGTGLGLAVVHGIVEKHGGDIRVTSEPGSGATFEVSFPRHGSAIAGSLAPAPTLGTSAGGKETILLVEDDDLVRRATRSVLRRLGYTLLEATNAADALAICEESGRHIDLLLTDVVMPGMGGPELAARARLTRPELRVLFLSGYARELVEAEGLLAPRVAFVQKPVSPATLGRKVREVLEAPPANRDAPPAKS